MNRRDFFTGATAAMAGCMLPHQPALQTGADIFTPRVIAVMTFTLQEDGQTYKMTKFERVEDPAR